MIGIIGPSSVIAQGDLARGVERLEDAGFNVAVHPATRKKSLFFSGTHAERAQAFYDWAKDPRFRVLWCARGGYGAGHLLPLLEELTRLYGVPDHKLLAGYSDTTALFEFVRARWGWSVLHAPLVARPEFFDVKGRDWTTLTAWLNQASAEPSWARKKLQFLTPKPRGPVEGILSGGNLKVWTSLIGTGFLPRSGPPILFLEEISETLSRIDQLFFQLAHSGGLEGVRAVVLGDFTNCKDPAPTGHLNAKAKKQMPLRAEIPVWTAVKEILLPYSKKYGFVVARGLPVGHGPGRASLPIGARYRLTPAGTFELLDWDWIR